MVWDRFISETFGCAGGRNRIGIRWLEVTSDEGQGLRFCAQEKAFEGSVLPYSAYELEHALHIEELPVPHYTWVRIAESQMGNDFHDGRSKMRLR